MSLFPIIDRSGRIALPRSVLKRLNLVPGTRLRLDVVAERIELTLAPVIVRKGRRLVLKSRGANEDAKTATRAERDERAVARRR